MKTIKTTIRIDASPQTVWSIRIEGSGCLSPVTAKGPIPRCYQKRHFAIFREH